MDLLRERIQWADRTFVAVGARGVKVLSKLLADQPLVDITEPNGERFSRATGPRTISASKPAKGRS